MIKVTGHRLGGLSDLQSRLFPSPPVSLSLPGLLHENEVALLGEIWLPFNLKRSQYFSGSAQDSHGDPGFSRVD